MSRHNLPDMFIAFTRHPGGRLQEVARRGPEEDENTPGTEDWPETHEINVGSYLELNGRRYYVIAIERPSEEIAHVIFHWIWLSVEKFPLSRALLGDVVEFDDLGPWYRVLQEPGEEGDLYLVEYRKEDDLPNGPLDRGVQYRKIPWPKDNPSFRVVHVD